MIKHLYHHSGKNKTPKMCYLKLRSRRRFQLLNGFIERSNSETIPIEVGDLSGFIVGGRNFKKNIRYLCIDSGLRRNN